MLTLTPDELHELTGYRQPAAQLAELHRQGFHRARRVRTGHVILERAHFEAVRSSTAPKVDISKVAPKQCFHENSAKRAEALSTRTPKWADLVAIEAVYAEARRLTAETGVAHHVDHEVPLQGRLVSGLHVHTNLRVMVGDDNVRKSNRFEVE